MNDCETRFSAIELEFLNIVYALKKFRRLILFNKCEVHTDHKPILGLLDKKLDNMLVRIQKWIIQIQAFDISFHYIAGKRNVLLDALSRNPLSVEPEDDELDDTEYTVCFMLKSSPLDLKRIAEATATNEGLKAVIEAVDNSWSTLQVRKLAPYYGMRDQLSVKRCSQGSESDVLLKGGMVVIPEGLVQDFLLQVHSGHLGCSKMKALVQSCAYWPGFSKDIDEFVRRCQACTVYQTKTDRAPLQSVASTVKEPSHTIAIDLTGPNDEALKGNTLLTIIDMHT